MGRDACHEEWLRLLRVIRRELHFSLMITVTVDRMLNYQIADFPCQSCGLLQQAGIAGHQVGSSLLLHTGRQPHESVQGWGMCMTWSNLLLYVVLVLSCFICVNDLLVHLLFVYMCVYVCICIPVSIHVCMCVYVCVSDYGGMLGMV